MVVMLLQCGHVRAPKRARFRADQSLAVRCVNFGVFTAAWFSCVLGGARGWVWAAPAAASWHRRSTWPSPKRTALVRILLSVAAMGTVADMALVAFGVVTMPAARSACPPRSWFASLWIAFATTLDSSMSWLTHLQHRRACGFVSLRRNRRADGLWRARGWAQSHFPEIGRSRCWRWSGPS